MRLSFRAALAGAATLVVMFPLIAHATVPEPVTTPATGNTTYFDGLGSPYGGCGIPQAELDSQDFVALNVYDTPGDYGFYPRPVTDASKKGIWNNGLNCGRWVEVSVSDYCTGVNDGAAGQAFCRNGAWVADSFNGATLTMLVADSCGDSNAWCRDDPYHLDLAKPSLSRFTRNGASVGSLLPGNFNNRRMNWKFVSAPNYSGDIRIGFMQGAQRWWPAIAVSHLANGIHGVEYLADGAWRAATMNGDMGQSYVVGGTTSGGTSFQIRVRGVDDQLINDGRVYSFSLPSGCGSQCSAAYTSVSYTASSSASPSPSSPTPSASASASSSAPAGASCSATYAITGQWQPGFQAQVTVRNTGSVPIAGWRITWTLPSGETITQLWNGSYTVSGSAVTVTDVGWNGPLGPGASTSFGLTGTATGTLTAPVLTCTPRVVSR